MEIQQQIESNFKKAFEGFASVQKSMVQQIQKLPPEKATKFNTWMVEMNKAIQKQDIKKLIELTDETKELLK